MSWKTVQGTLACAWVGSVLVLAPLSGASPDDATVPVASWVYEGTWSRGEAAFAVRESRAVERDGDEGHVLRAWRTLYDRDGVPFSWQNETRVRDATGAVVRVNLTIVTHHGDDRRRIGIDTVYDAPCLEPWRVSDSMTVRCSGVRTVLGETHPFDEETRITLRGNVSLTGPQGDLETSLIDAEAGPTVVSYWLHPAACGTVQEETMSGDTTILLRLVRNKCMLPDATPVDELTYEEYQRMQELNATADEEEQMSGAEAHGGADGNATSETAEAPSHMVGSILLSLFGLVVVARAGRG